MLRHLLNTIPGQLAERLLHSCFSNLQVIPKQSNYTVDKFEGKVLHQDQAICLQDDQAIDLEVLIYWKCAVEEMTNRVP